MRIRSFLAAPTLLAVLALTLTTIAVGSPDAAEAQPAGGATWPGDHPDPDIIVGHDGLYYSYSTTIEVFSDVRVPVLASADLRYWELVADALPEPGVWAEPDEPSWAPSVARIGGRYVLYYTAVDRTTGQRCVGVATSAGPIGPFVDRSTSPLRCAHSGGDAVIDPSVFVSADGSITLHYKTTGITSRQIWGQSLTIDGLGLAGAPVHLLASTQAWERRGVENPEMVAIGDDLILFYSGDSWRTSSYATGLAVCASALGPCTSLGRWLASDSTVAGPGGASVVQDLDGDWWVAHHGWVDGRRPLYVRPLIESAFGLFTGNVLAPGSPGPAVDPIGTVDRIDLLDLDADGGRVTISGWALDRTTARPIQVHVYVDGVLAAASEAARDRPDVEARILRGSRHGYGVTLDDLAAGTHEMCVFGIAVGPGANRRLDCRTVTVPDQSPIGSFDDARRNPDGATIDAGGWAHDPDVDATVVVHLYLDGRLVEGVRAESERPDVAAALAITPRRGWHTTIAAGPGPHEVCAYAINAGPGVANTLLGCRTVP